MSLFSELKRRNVFRVGIAYIVGAWLLAQGTDFVLDVIGAPEIVIQSLIVVLAFGLVPTVVVAWIYEMTPEGVKKASEIDLDKSITHHTGKKLDVVTIVLLVAAVGFVVVERYLPGQGESESRPAERVEESVSLPDAESASETGTQIAAGGSFPATSIAVLPFENRSNQEDDLYFTDGVHDDLLTQLAKVHDLTVISRSTVMKYRNAPIDLKQVGEELQVGTILEGGVQKVGDRVRINAQLIDAATDHHLWAETFDRELTAENVFELQSEIAKKIVNAIAVQLSPEEERLLDAVPTRNLAAYESYLQGRMIFYGANYSRTQEMAAQPFIEKAIELDPDYAEAHALLSFLYGQQFWRGIDTSDALLEKYRESLDRATELSPDSPNALRAQANFHYRVERDYERSLELLERALEKAPGDVDILGDLGLTLRRLGRWDDSINRLQRALQLDPSNRFYRFIMLETMTAQHRWQDIIDNSTALEDARPDELDIQTYRAVALFNQTGSLEPFERVFERMPPIDSSQYFIYSTYAPWLNRDPDSVIQILNNQMWTSVGDDEQWRIHRTFTLADALRLKGNVEQATARYEETITLFESVSRSSINNWIFNGTVAAQALAHLGRFDEALALLDQVLEASPPERYAMTGGWTYQVRALIRGLAGDRDGAIDDLKLARRTPYTSPTTAWDLHYDPNWDFMRDDPRFVELATPENLIQ